MKMVLVLKSPWTWVKNNHFWVEQRGCFTWAFGLVFVVLLRRAPEKDVNKLPFLLVRHYSAPNVRYICFRLMELLLWLKSISWAKWGFTWLLFCFHSLNINLLLPRRRNQRRYFIGLFMCLISYLENFLTSSTWWYPNGTFFCQSPI